MERGSESESGAGATAGQEAANGDGPVVSYSAEAGDLRSEAAIPESADGALVRRARAGEREAFGQLVRRYQRRAVSVAYRLLGNLEDASDVSQDAFVRAFEHLSQLDDPARFGAWLMRVVCNLSLNYRRSRATRAASSLPDSLGAAPAPRDAGDGQPLTARSTEDEGAASEEVHAAITAAVNRLPEKQRLALVLFTVEGLPQKEVAAIMECSVELVKWNVFQARRNLKETLKPFL